MLTRIVQIVMIVGSEMDTSVVKKLYSDKFLPEQSSAVGLVKKINIKFCEICFVDDLKPTVKKRNISRKQSFSLLILIFIKPFQAYVAFLYPLKTI